MTITNTVVADDFVGGGTAFVIPFDFEEESAILVYNNTVLQVEGVGNDYTLTDYVDSLPTKVTFNAATAGTDTITLKRDLAIQQTTAFLDTDPTPLEEFESGLDRLTRRVQEVDHAQTRNVTLPEGGSLSELEMPEPVADKYLGWNSAATALENKTVDTTTIEADIVTLQADVGALKLESADYETRITTNTGDIATNVADIATNTGNISANESRLTVNEADIITNADANTASNVRISDLESFFGTIGQQTLLNNQAVGVDITDLVFDGNVFDSIIVHYNVIRTTDTNYRGEAGTLHAICKGNGVWYLENGLQVIEIAGCTYTITTTGGKTGTISYISDDLTGTGYSGKINYNVIKFEV